MTELLADELRDMRLGPNKQINIGSDGDWELTSGVETVEQSVMLEASEVLKPLIGEPLGGATYEDIQSSLSEILEDDPQIASVNRVNITSVNTDTGVITLDVFTEFNNSFTINVPTEG